jgi:hypothetical protein
MSASARAAASSPARQCALDCPVSIRNERDDRQIRRRIRSDRLGSCHCFAGAAAGGVRRYIRLGRLDHLGRLASRDPAGAGRRHPIPHGTALASRRGHGAVVAVTITVAA